MHLTARIGIYASGEWFEAHPECCLRDKTDRLVNITTKYDDTHRNCHLGASNRSGTAHCYVYGFDTHVCAALTTHNAC